MGAEQEPGRRAPVGRQGAPPRTIPRCPRPVARSSVPTMLTTDLSLRFDPAYEKISRRFLEHPEAVRRRLRPRLVQADPPRHGPARALPRVRRCRPKSCIWQDPIPAVDHPLIDAQDIAALKDKILASGLSVSRAGVDRLGVGLHLPRLRQARRRQRRAHSPRAAEGLGRSISRRSSPRCSKTLEGIQSDFNSAAVGRQEGLARRSDRARRLRRRRAGGEERRSTP